VKLKPLKVERYLYDVGREPQVVERDVARITLPRDGVCHHNYRGTHAIVDLPARMYDDEYAYRVNDHDDCMCNELVALHNRHLTDDPEVLVTFSGVDEMRAEMFRMVERMRPEHMETWSYEQVITRMPKSKQNRYWQAMRRLRNDYDVTPKDAKIKMMDKAEKIALAKLREGKAGRAVQYRSPEYNLALMAAGLKSIEHEFYTRMQYGKSKTRNVAKCLNHTQRARILRKKWDEFADPVAILLDAKAWDAHVHTELLGLEHEFYMRCMPENRRLAWLLSMQEVNKGWTKRGIKYSIKGTRMSGDANTALGNCVLNLMMLKAWLRFCGVEGEILLDGDDSVIIVERDQLNKLDVEHITRNYGMNMKMEIAEVFEDIDFCQCKPLECAEGWRMVRYPDRVMSKDVVCVRNMPGRWHALAHALGRAELSLCSGVPILQEFALMLIRAGKSGKITNKKGKLQEFGEQLQYVAKMQARTTGWDGAAVSLTTRVSFWAAFDICPDLQLQMESWLRNHNPTVNPRRDVVDYQGEGVPA
jgi:hypothetical protein